MAHPAPGSSGRRRSDRPHLEELAINSREFAPSSSLVVTGVLLLVFGQFLVILASSSGAAVAIGALAALAGLITLLIGLKQLAVNVDLAAQVAATELKRQEAELARASREQEGETGLPGGLKPWV